MQKNERGDDLNIAVAEGVSRSVKSSRGIAPGKETAVGSLNVDNNSIEYDCVRISPSFMEFKDACEGMTFRQLFMIQNMGKHKAHVRICSPNSIAFKIKTLKDGVFLSPGLRILRWVHYSYKRNSVLHTMIPIYINRKYIDYHVICTSARASLSIEPTSLDFGLIDIGSTSGIKMLTLKNDGGQSIKFAVDLGPNEMDISVKPMRGILQARSKIFLRVELIGIEEGSFFGEFWIKSSPNIRVPVQVNIIIPRLVVYHPNTTGDFTLIDFPLTFANTTRHDTIIVRSLSAQVSNFVVLGEIDNDLIPFKHIDLKKHPAFQVFTIYPLEGRMDPFEGRIFNITFSPTVKITKDTEEFRKRDRQDFMVFVRVFRVHCTEVEDIVSKEMSLDDRAEEPPKNVQLLEADSAESLEMSDNEPPESPGYETVRLCLYGETEEARLDFVPNELHLGAIGTGEVVHRELTISNPSSSVSVAYKFVPNPIAHCEPSAGRIKPTKSLQVLITVTGNYNVEVPFKLMFDVVIRTCNLTNLKTLDITAKPCWVLAWYKLMISPVKNKRKKAPLGETQASMQYVQEKDHPFCLDYKYALSPKGAAFKSSHRLYWSNYIRLKRTGRVETALKRLTVISGDVTDCQDLLTAKLPKIKVRSIAQRMLGEAATLKVVNKANDELLVPLSPLQIYNVRIAPTVLTYGSVAPKSTNYRTLLIENLNDFPVMVRLVSRVSKAISFPNESLTVVRPGSQITKIVEYRAQGIGKFNTHIDYIINDNHSFAMTVAANVVFKSLNLNIREITFGKRYWPREAYQPLTSIIEIKNKLDASASFNWDLRSNASFSIYPMSGEVRGNRTLFAEVSYEPNALKSNNTDAVLTCESGTWTNLRLNSILKEPDVAFINNTLNLDQIPLNMITTAIGVLHNAEFREVMFQVDQSSLIHGCEVFPHHGVILPRGIFNLEVRLRFDACFKFSITIEVVIEKCLKLELKLHGQVAYPMLQISPESITMKRISTDASASHSLTASNTGNTVFKLQFLLEEYPEYRASLSPRRTDPAIESEGLTILPGASASIYLHFIPIDLASYSFYLPIVINEILGPVLIESPTTIRPSEFLQPREIYYVQYAGIKITELPPSMPTVFIDCIVLGHVISFSKHVFNFNVMSNKVEDELRVFNDTHKEVSFIIRIDDFSESRSPFSITWLSGVEPTITSLSIVCTLQPQEQILFLIEFKPIELGKFDIEAPIFIRGELEGNVFNTLLLEGINLASCVLCDKTELYFAPVPLDVETEQRLTLKVGQCQNPSNIKAVVLKPEKFVGNYTDNCIQVKFIGDNYITGQNSNEELEISVLFRSELPVAFGTRIEFRVTDTVECFLNVCAIADNCILTTYGYLRGNIELDGVAKRQERISFPSITSQEEDSSSLTKPDLIMPRKKGETMLLTRLSVHPSISVASQKSLKSPVPQLKDQNVEEKSDITDEDDVERASLKSKVSSTLPSGTDQYSKLSKAVYPYFPIINKTSDTADCQIQQTLAATEQWMYSCGFQFNFYPNIVEGITAVLSGLCSTTSRANERQKQHAVGQSIVDLIVSLAGIDVLKYIGDTSHLPEDPLQRVRYVLRLYGNLLEFLDVQGAFLPHVKPQFLLSYKDYLLNDMEDKSVIKNRPLLEAGKPIKNDTMSREMFQSRSKQCWLDVALQTFKTLVLKRININNLRDNITSSYNQCNQSTAGILEHVAKQMRVKENTKNPSKFTTEETLLLTWLQHHFEQQRLEGWMKDEKASPNPFENGHVLESRTISNFEGDLADSLVLIAVTVGHARYLIEDHFKNIFISPRNLEEIHHNAVCLTTAWRRIRLGFMITPGQIARPNCVQMVMLVSHLFLTLPTFLPSQEIQFCCPLTETVTRQISLNNKTEFPVTYVVEFIGNEMDLFNAVIPQPVFKLEARNAGSLKIRYRARKISKTRAYVILCGSSVAPNFARNQVFILEGCTSYLCITNNYDIERILYKVSNETLNIPVPFKEAAEYDILLTEEQPTVPASLKLSRWADLKTRKVPRRLFINQETIIVSENSHEVDLSITIACIAPTNRSFWILFESKIGDFIIQINSTSKKATTDYITVEWEWETCTCLDLVNGISSTCPLNIKLAIPARNTQLWNCINEMFQKTLNQHECLFWSRHLDTNIGLRLIHWLMGDYHDLAAKEFMHIFNTSITYDVKTTGNENLIVPDRFAIPDVRPREEVIHMPVHILQATPRVYASTISLSSPDGMEYRTYTINFICKTPIPPAVTSGTNTCIEKKFKRK